MNYYFTTKMRNILLILFLHAVTGSSVKPAPICCFPNQFEAFMFLSQGDVDVGSEAPGSGNVGYGYGYFNGTASTAFDGVKQLTYSHHHSLNFMSLYPIPITLDTIDILDYINNVQWMVYADGSCDKMDVGLPLYAECIPGNASLVSEGTFGNTGRVVKTYLFYDRIYLDPNEVTITVLMSDDKPGECIPVRMTMSDSYVFDSNKNVEITVADIFDFSPGIKDRSVFTPPSACDNATIVQGSEIRWQSGGLLETVKNLSHRLKQRR